MADPPAKAMDLSRLDNLSLLERLKIMRIEERMEKERQKKYDKEQEKKDKEEKKKIKKEKKVKKDKPSKDNIPRLVSACIKYLEENGLTVEGILRVSGSSVQIKTLKRAYEKGKKVKLEDVVQDVHTVAGLLKAYFRDLPEPLLLQSLYKEWISVIDLPHDQKIEKLIRLVNQLPAQNKEILDRLIQFLLKVSAHSSINKMDANNLATMLAPNILRHNDLTMEGMLRDTVHCVLVVHCLILEYNTIFAKPDQEEAAGKDQESVESNENSGVSAEASPVTSVECYSQEKERSRAKTLTSDSPEQPTHGKLKRAESSRALPTKKERRMSIDNSMLPEKLEADTLATQLSHKIVTQKLQDQVVLSSDSEPSSPMGTPKASRKLEKKSKKEKNLTSDSPSSSPIGSPKISKDGFKTWSGRSRPGTPEVSSSPDKSGAMSSSEKPKKKKKEKLKKTRLSITPDNNTQASPLLFKLISHLNATAMDVENLFTSESPDKAREILQQGVEGDLTQWRSVEIAAALKLHLASNEALLQCNDDTYTDLLAAADITDQNSRVWLIRELLEDSIEGSKRESLKVLSILLYNMVSNSSVNHTSGDELASVFAPLLFPSQKMVSNLVAEEKIIASIIDDPEKLFQL